MSGQVAATLVSIHPQHDAPVPPGFREEVVIPLEGTVVALAGDHRFADREEVDLADLGGGGLAAPARRAGRDADGPAPSLRGRGDQAADAIRRRRPDRFLALRRGRPCRQHLPRPRPQPRRRRAPAAGGPAHRDPACPAVEPGPAARQRGRDPARPLRRLPRGPHARGARAQRLRAGTARPCLSDPDPAPASGTGTGPPGQSTPVFSCRPCRS
ncbi:hypothetical protein G5V59_14015 [Nocardioides sp. W3-2-3]|uniref:hypothetical protein n=1 Tax=Nocardioides convexus TaxID=2712224 RepID=UPI0024189E5D|nr:hypothetical protein [Nocardioides convexus]NHA00735.1 hypothetical protein [Nocardioides convexus]